MTTDNVAEMTSEQLRDKLAQTRAELTQLRKQSTTPVQECGYCGYRYSAGIETSNFNVMAEHIKSCPAHPLAKALTELAQARAELAAVDESLGEFHCPVLDPKTEEPCGSFWEDHGVHLMKGALGHAEAALVLSAKALARQHDVKTEAGQLCSELKDLQGANRALARQVADVTDNREFWYERAQDAETKMEGLERRLAGIEAQAAATKEAVEWIWGFWDGNTLVARSSGYEEEIGAAWNKLLAASNAFSKSREHHGGTAEKILERLTTLGAAEAELTELSEEHDQLVDRVEDAMGQIEKYDKHLAENLIQYAVEDILERLVEAERELRQRLIILDVAETAAPSRKRIPERLTKADLAAHVRDLTQTVDTERRSRQKAEHYAEALKDTMTGIHEALNKCQVKKAYDDDCPASARTRIFWLNRRAERAEALAQLVTPELAALLERLANLTHKFAFGKTSKRARALAAEFRRALDDSQA